MGEQFIYAQLNDNMVCVTVCILDGENNDPKLVRIPTYSDDYLWKKYENHQWSEAKHIPGTVIMSSDALQFLLDKQALMQIAIDDIILNGGAL